MFSTRTNTRTGVAPTMRALPAVARVVLSSGFLLLAAGPAAPRAEDAAEDAARTMMSDEERRAMADAELQPDRAGEGARPQAMGAQRKAALERERQLRRRARLVPHYEYLEDSYLDYFLPRVGPAGDRPLSFEAQAATHLFLVNQWDKVEKPTSRGAMASVWSWDVSFLLKLRMVQDRSAPVRPPSYMPGMHLQWFGLWKTAGGAVQELEAELGLTHHSNGQQQCPFVPPDQQDQASPDTCLSPGRSDGSLRHEVNYRSGDFSTSYGTVGMHYAFMRLDPDHFMASRWSLGASYEQDFVTHDAPFGDFPGAMERDQAWMYGIHRVKVDAQVRWHVGPPLADLAGVFSISASHERMWNTGPHIPGDRTIAEASYTLDGFHGAGLFVRGFTGQDDLNILYAAGRTNKVVAGLIWSTSPAVRYLFGEGEVGN